MKIWHPGYVIAVIIIIGCFILIFSGVDGEVKSILALASGFIFRGMFEKIREAKIKNGH